jgi:hypothetical protein
MAKEIIFYNLKDSVTDQEYIEWCENYKGPILLSLNSAKSFTLLKMLRGLKGNGEKGIPPSETVSPYKYIGIMDLSSLEDWEHDSATKAFKEEFFPQRFSNWVKDFFIIGGEEVYYKESHS